MPRSRGPGPYVVAHGALASMGGEGVRHWFAQPLALGLLAMLPALALLSGHAARHRRRALERLGVWPWHADLVLLRPGRRRVQTACLLAGLGLLAVAAAGPRWGREWARAAAPVRDLVVVLDLSRSMLARDTLPSRLGRAKQALVELADAIQRAGSHRLALVVFAGRARLACPLTYDYGFFTEAVSQADPDNPDITPTGTGPAVSGTRIGAALRLAVQSHARELGVRRDILLVSDGDDPARDGEWRAGLAAAREARIPIHVVGVGDPETASEILVAGFPLVGPDGLPARTRLEEEPLREIAAASGGLYLPARTAPPDLGTMFRELLAPLMVREEAEDLLPQVRLRYGWFLAAAFGFLALEMCLVDRRGRPVNPAPFPPPAELAA